MRPLRSVVKSMPTSTGGETIEERLERLRTELTSVRNTISRQYNNGREFEIDGNKISQIALEHAYRRERKLEQDIRFLEARLIGSSERVSVAQTVADADGA